MRKAIGFFICLGLLICSDSAQAAVEIFEFSFTNPAVGGNTHSPTYTDYFGTVTGFLTFAGVGSNLLPTNVSITSAPAGLSANGLNFTPVDASGGFNVTESTLTVLNSGVSIFDANTHHYNLAFGGVPGSQNFLLHVDDPAGGITGNDNGPSAVDFTPVSAPEPSTEALIGFGLLGLMVAFRRNGKRV